MAARSSRGQATIEILGVMALIALLLVGLESLIQKNDFEKASSVFKLQRKETVK